MSADAIAAAPALAASESGELAIVPQRFEKIYRGWLTDIRDWCISRQLWWGHRIPVYYVHENAEALSAARSGTGKGSSPHYVVARDEAEAYAKARAADFGPTFDPQTLVLYQEEDVLDTWFSSGLWPFSTLGWPNSDAEDLARGGDPVHTGDADVHQDHVHGVGAHVLDRGLPRGDGDDSCDARVSFERQRDRRAQQLLVVHDQHAQ